MLRLSQKKKRRGEVSVQTAFVMVIVAAGIIGTVITLGTSTKDELNQTAGEVGDPSTLVNRWKNNGDAGGEEGDSEPSEGGDGGYGFR